MSKFRLRRLGLADDPGNYRPTLQGCLDAVLEQSDVLIDDVLDGLRISMGAVGGTSQVAVATAQGKEVMALLVQRAPDLKQIFAQQLRNSMFGGEAARQVSHPLVRFDDFQFLEADQIDANIEFALTQQEVLMSVEDVLPVLNAMISNLMGWSSVQAHLNPLKPESFVHALRESLRQLVPDPSARSTVMGQAATRLGVSLRQLYVEVADWLRSLGVEPAITVSASSGQPAGEAPLPTTLKRTMLTLDKLRRLLSGELDPAQANPGADFVNTVPASFDALQDMRMVEMMMQRLAEKARKNETPPVAPEPAAAPEIQLDEANRKRLGLQLGEEVVHMMLDNLMKDARLLLTVRENIQALEGVLLRLSSSDPRFFSDRQHPARRFLDRMTHRSLAYSAEDDAGYRRFQKTFSNAVSVLCNGDGDATAFARVLRKLEDAWEREEQEQRVRREEAARALLHAEQRNLLAQKLAVQFRERIQNRAVPELVQTFLFGPWAQVVAQAQLGHADGSVDPQGYQNLVDDLVWSVQLRLARRNRKRLVQLVPEMLVKMREGLALISYPQERINAFFNALVGIHEQVFDTPRPGRDAPQPPPEAPVSVGGLDSTEDPDVWMVQSEASDSGYLDDRQRAPIQDRPSPDVGELAPLDLEHLSSGAWVDLALEGVWVRAQLTWASPHRTLFMFVSGNGLAHSMSRRTLQRLYTKGLIRLISDGRVMDNALDAVAQTALRNALNRDSDQP